MKKIVLIALAVFSLAAFIGAQQAGYLQFKQGGKTMNVMSGGTIAVKSGGSLTVASGATFTINSVPVTVSNLWKGTENVIALLADSTLMSYTSGSTYIARPIAAKTTATLPTAAAGLNYAFYIADTDSLLVKAAGTDSLIVQDGSAKKTTTTVAGSAKFVSLGSTGKWFIIKPAGTWTSY